MHLFRWLPVVAIILILPAIAASHTGGVQASPQMRATATAAAQPTPTFDLRRLDRPKLSSTSSDQIKKGSIVYWGMCMSCHGDRGQGLTEDWRNAYGPEERDCWQSGCHGAEYPPDSFLMPTDAIAPAIAGTDSLPGLKSAQELHDFVSASMPWWNPGQLTEAEAWQVTSYVLTLRKVMPANLELNDTNASAIPTQYAVPSPSDDRAAVLALSGILVLASLGLLAQANWKDKPQVVEYPNFFHHLHPPTVPAIQARFRYTLGAGGMAVFLCWILLVTGILEMFYYIPVPEHAPVSIERITFLVPFGALIRNLHFWSAQALMIVASLHLLRVVLTGAYARRRRLNYLVGLGMFVLVLLLDFTGYVLRWDEGIRWALVVGTNLLKTIPWIGEWVYQVVVGGSQPGLSSLERFYTWHIFVLTLAAIILGAWHIFRVRRDGGLAVPPPQQRADGSRLSRFDLVRREVIVMLIAGVLLLLISNLFPAPLERPISPTMVDLPSVRAPWFFLWVQQLLKLGDAFLYGVAVPVLLLLALAMLPYALPQAADHEFGRWFPHGNRRAQIVILLIALTISVLTILAILPTTHL